MKNQTSSQTDLPLRERRWFVPALVAIILFGLLAVIFFADPFNWHWQQRLEGQVITSIAAMPPDSLVVAQFDSAMADLPQLTALWQTFVAATADFDPPLQNPFQAFTQWQQELNMTLATDVRPWLGQTVSLSLLSLADDLATAEWVIAADSVDEAAADTFLTKLAAGWQGRTGIQAVGSSYQRVSITSFSNSLAIGRSDNLVLIGSSAAAVQQAIDAQYDQSIADNAAYQEAIATLPANQPLTVYVAGNQVQPILAMVWAQTAVATTLPLPQLISSHGLHSLAFTITATEAGLQIDSSTQYDPAQLSAAQQAALDIWLVQPQTDQIAPENTLLYLNGSGFNLLWDSYLDALSANPDQADSMAAIELLGDQFGLNPNSDLFPYLDGETAVILTPSRSGTAAQTLRLNLGGTLLAYTSDPDTLSANLAGFTTAITAPQLGLATVQATAVHDIPLNQIATSLVPGLFLVYGVGQEYLLLSSSADSIGELIFGNGRSLADNPDFQRAQAALPATKKPALFVNVTELVETFRTSGFMLAQAREFERQTAVLRPIHLLSASSSVSENIVQNRIVLFIEK